MLLSTWPAANSWFSNIESTVNLFLFPNSADDWVMITQNQLSELRIHIQWIAECLLSEQRFNQKVVSSTLSCCRELNRSTKCNDDWHSTLIKVKQLKQKLFDANRKGNVVRRPNRLRVITNKVSGKQYHPTYDEGTVISSMPQHIIKLSKMLIFQLLKSFWWKWKNIKDAIDRSRRLFEISTIKLCFLSIALSSLSDRYVSICADTKARKKFSISKCRKALSILLRNTNFNRTARKTAERHHFKVCGYFVLAVLSNNWKLWALKRKYLEYLSKACNAKSKLRAWIAWTASVSLLKSGSIFRQFRLVVSFRIC